MVRDIYYLHAILLSSVNINHYPEIRDLRISIFKLLKLYFHKIYKINQIVAIFNIIRIPYSTSYSYNIKMNHRSVSNINKFTTEKKILKCQFTRKILTKRVREQFIFKKFVQQWRYKSESNQWLGVINILHIDICI